VVYCLHSTHGRWPAILACGLRYIIKIPETARLRNDVLMRDRRSTIIISVTEISGINPNPIVVNYSGTPTVT